jgi:Integrase zinc binding domain
MSGGPNTFMENGIRIVIPKSLRQTVLKLLHGSRVVGHWGVLRTAARLKRRFWWSGWYAVVELHVAGCLACQLSKVRRSKRQAKMQVWHPRARFDTVAVDVLDVSPKSRSGTKKVVVMGDLFRGL